MCNCFSRLDTWLYKYQGKKKKKNKHKIENYFRFFIKLGLIFVNFYLTSITIVIHKCLVSNKRRKIENQKHKALSRKFILYFAVVFFYLTFGTWYTLPWKLIGNIIFVIAFIFSVHGYKVITMMDKLKLYTVLMCNFFDIYFYINITKFMPKIHGKKMDEISLLMEINKTEKWQKRKQIFKSSHKNTLIDTGLCHMRFFKIPMVEQRFSLGYSKLIVFDSICSTN